MRRVLPLMLVALVAAAGTALAAPGARVGVHQTSLGKVLADAKGRTLYVFDGASCTGACAAAWPPLLTAGKPTGVAKLGTKKLANGKLQVTFAGKPLYRYAVDRSPGDVNGASVAHWFALSPAGAKLHAAASGGYGGDYGP